MNKNIYPTLFFVLSVFFFIACGQRKADNNQQPTIENNISIAQPRTFNHVSILENLTSPEERAAYLVTHYWNNFNFSDTTYIHIPEITEQAFVDYLAILPHTTREIADTSIKAMLARTTAEDATGKMYAYFLDLYRQYLHDPNSPMRNEEFYISVVEFIIENSVSDFATKTRAEFDLSMMLKNRIGTTAADFSYITADGVRGTLHGLNRDFTIIYFHNPGCTACEEAANLMRIAPTINHLLNVGRIDILAVYADEDLDLWSEHRDQIFPRWINARDEPRIIKNRILYDLRAIPSLYLLDRNKTVLLKDSDVVMIDTYLNRLEEARRGN
ncbi:MAG: DUF5106 domain-containing protein [Dysgonamonadaceae bacterium]|jgi:hypothetical protein|nr:DUF5106 domain-containing protein [Dysgonamonadaceae bacterium]